MRRATCEEKWLQSNMVPLAAVGFPLHRMVLRGVVFGDTYQNVGRDSLLTFPLR